MKKKLIISASLLLGLAAIAFGTVLFWPLSFSDLIIADTEMRIIRVDNSDEFEKPDSADYCFEPGSEKFIQVQEILEKYSYHRSLRSLFRNTNKSADISSMEEQGVDYRLEIYTGKDFENLILFTYTGEIIINNREYRVGYFGNDTVAKMMIEIRSVLDNE